jgi:PKD repeat protein
MKNLSSSFTRRVSTFLAAAVVLVGALCVSPQARATGNPKLPPGLDLGRNSRGEDAVALLGARLPEVAVAYGLQPAELRGLLLKHTAMWVDRKGSLLYLCEGSAVSATAEVQPTGTTTTTVTTTVVAATPSSFTLHSTPGATKVIYLDFTGHVTSGTSWNSAFTGGADIVSQPFDLDGNPAAFSEAECAFIYLVWQRVAADFAPFSVDVTTEDPGVEALRYTGTGDSAYGQRVVISPTNWYNTNGGGVSYVGSFNWSSDTPNFVFTQQLANGEKYIAEAISHETGHALGLNHEGLGGSAPTEYYEGQGDWAPIMGNSYYRTVTQWCKGEYLNANNTEDQLAVMQNYGAPLTSNTYGATLASATPISAVNFPVVGTIMTRSDGDVFRFNTGAGAISLTAAAISPEANLNLYVQLFDAAGTTLQTGTASVTSVTVAATVTAGTYYLKISGVGSGDPLTTGYSNYASLGDYVLTGSLVPNDINQAPIASATGTPTTGLAPLPVAFSSTGSFDPDGTVTAYSWDFGDGTSSTAASPAKTYAVAGSYTARLSVTDDRGAVGSATVTITVSPPPVADTSTDIDVAQFDLAAKKVPSGTTGTATIYVRDRLGRPVAGATVNVQWSGLVSTTSSGKTDALGKIVVTSDRSKKTGTVWATITALTPPAGQLYDATIYSEPMVRSVVFY